MLNAEKTPLNTPQPLGNWPVGGLKTTTEVLRHVPRLQRLFQQADIDGIRNCRMVEIGPGAAVAFLAEGLTRPELKTFSLAEVRFQTFRFAESVLRHIPFMPLRSLEPVEIVDQSKVVTSNEILGELVIVDRDTRVLRSAQHAMELRPQLRTSFVQFDVNANLTWPYPPAQIVCAYKCSHLLDDPGRLFTSVAKMLLDGGLFSTTDTVQHENFVAVDEQAGLYRKVRAKDGTTNGSA